MNWKKKAATVLAGVVAVTSLASATPAAADGGTRGGWIPAPQEAFEQPAGARCDFPVRVQPVVDEVRKLVLAEYPDGSPRRELYTGALIDEVTNLDTGAVTRVDASGTSLVEYAADGSMTWYVTGPVLLGFREDAGSLPRGIWIVDGVYVVQFDPTYVHKTITMVRGTTHNVCTDVV
ncbi:hypothetical protein I0C86_21395 [Plantactinospora sp. S1510]|uniref:Uncharacterized protein n=1 Tax=Plantactinospora alkalitolerans TaxID=2789879 RepID=A0ABS0GZ51_9ACTN|nr:hypothetical protein [Plantactinospora alkalitolerans]MBF9131496.1 hypothetical protein [Plantactinospora alkalitolerans]